MSNGYTEWFSKQHIYKSRVFGTKTGDGASHGYATLSTQVRRDTTICKFRLRQGGTKKFLQGMRLNLKDGLTFLAVDVGAPVLVTTVALYRHAGEVAQGSAAGHLMGKPVPFPYA